MSKCGEKTEVYSRVTGYFRPVTNWNKGKREEFKERRMFSVPKIVPLFAVVGAMLFLLTGCLSPTQTTIEEYDASGKVTKKTVTSESIVKNVVDSTKDKTVVVWDNSFLAYISATAATTEDPTPTVKMGVGKADKGALTLHKDHSVEQAAAIIGAARASEISVSATGVSSKSTEKKEAVKTTVTETTK